MELVQLSTEAVLGAWTVQGFLPKIPLYVGETDPGKFIPYGVGFVTIDDRLKVQGHLTLNDPRQLRAGMRMRLTAIPP
jgi:uncharacterized OB-fold protein